MSGAVVVEERFGELEWGGGCSQIKTGLDGGFCPGGGGGQPEIK